MKRFLLLFLVMTEISWGSLGSPQSVENKTIDKIFNPRDGQKETGFCFELPGSTLPDLLQGTRNTLAKGVNLSPQQIRAEFAKGTTAPKSVTDEIDRKSRYLKEAEEKKLKFSGQEKPSQFVGGNPRNYRITVDESLKGYLSFLFLQIEGQSSKWNPTVLSRADLFHGHLVFHRGLKDLFIVFHAKEYPRDNPALCESCPIQRLLSYFDVMLPSGVREIPPSLAYQRRNFVWSLKRNSICGVDTTLPSFVTLAQTDGDGCTLDESKLSDLGEGGEIANIVYLPREGVPLFFDFHLGI